MVIIFISLALTTIISIYSCWRFKNWDYKRDIIKGKIIPKQVIRKVHIATYNIRSLNKGNDLHNIVKELREEEIDIVCLQEVDKCARRSKKMDMLAEIANQTGYRYYFFYETMWILNGYYGLGIVSKYPITKIASHELPNSMFSEPRILASATIQVHDVTLHIYNTHLHDKKATVRKKQVTYIQQLLARQTNTIVLGDMNTASIAEFYQIEGMHAINTPDTLYYTYQDTGFTDNILYSQNLTLENAKVRKSYFSDHHLFSCILKIDKNLA